jgi:site-specific recombinase XerD
MERQPIDEIREECEKIRKQAWEEAFQAWLKGQKSEARRRDYQRIWRQFQEACGKTPDEVTEQDVEKWAMRLAEEGYAASTIRTYLASLSSFYKFLLSGSRRPANLNGDTKNEIASHRSFAMTIQSGEEGQEASWQGLIQHNPVDQEARPKAQPYDRVRYLSQEEEARLLGAIDLETTWGKRDYALILFLLRSGRHTKEALGLRWGDFEVGREGAWYRQPDSKRRLDWETWAAISRYLEGCGKLGKMSEEEVIFTPLTDAAGRVKELYGEEWEKHSLAEVSVGRSIQMYAGWAGLEAEEITPKALRYTAASNLLRKGCRLEELKEFMGHTDLDVTRVFLKGIEGSERRVAKGEKRVESSEKGEARGESGSANCDLGITESERREARGELGSANCDLGIANGELPEVRSELGIAKSWKMRVRKDKGVVRFYDGGGARGRSYESKRRTVGAPEGNQNAFALAKYLEGVEAEGLLDGLVDELKKESGLDMEIVLLRVVFGVVGGAAMETESLEEGMRWLRVMGSLAGRIADLVYKRWKMKRENEKEDVQEATRQAIQELWEEWRREKAIRGQ